MIALYIFGVVHWLFFLDFGRFEFDYHDWGLAAHYLVGIREGLLTGQLPLHLNPWLVTERFLANPELLLSPQVFLLFVIDLRQFLLVNTLILYTAGFAGLVLLARRFNLSAISFTLLFLIFNLNGHITAHLAAGHMMWLAYFLTPFLILLVFDAADRGVDRRWPALVALVLLAMLLQGAFHFVLWSLLLIAVLAITQPSLRRPAFLALFLTAALGAIRYLPALVEFGNRDWTFVGGFRSASEVLEALIVLKSPIEAVETRFHLPEYWEIDHYVGLLALGFLVVFGVAYWIRKANDESARPVRALAPAILVLTMLALDPILRVLMTLPIPLLFAERVTSRFFILPLLFVLLFAAIALDRWLRNQRLGPGKWMLLSFGLLVIALDLWQHSRLWRLTEARHAFEIVYPNLTVAINNHADPVYLAALAAGAAITVVALIYSGWLILRRSGRAPVSAEAGAREIARESERDHG
ncbi:MAG: hypothetical protein ACE5M4_06525 [Anaerolineales bacterium]